MYIYLYVYASVCMCACVSVCVYVCIFVLDFKLTTITYLTITQPDCVRPLLFGPWLLMMWALGSRETWKEMEIVDSWSRFHLQNPRNYYVSTIFIFN